MTRFLQVGIITQAVVIVGLILTLYSTQLDPPVATPTPVPDVPAKVEPIEPVRPILDDDVTPIVPVCPEYKVLSDTEAWARMKRPAQP